MLLMQSFCLMGTFIIPPTQLLVSRANFATQCLHIHYTVTIQVDSNLQVLFQYEAHYQNASFVLMSTGGLNQPEWSPCRSCGSDQTIHNLFRYSGCISSFRSSYNIVQRHYKTPFAYNISCRQHRCLNSPT